MSEQTMRGRVVRMLTDLNGIAVENPALPGTPDVNYVEGWIELKHLREWPVRENTAVLFEHFTPQQRIWHIRRRAVGGTSWMLVQCEREWLLFDGAVAAISFNLLTHNELIELTSNYSDHGLDAEGLVRWISHKQSEFTFNDGARAKLRKLLQRGSMLPSVDT